jgi:phosphatidylserine/phosphatidylglycerophosphate/cardiolipin synthase-like enzyme
VSDAGALVALGAFLTATEARQVADRLADGEPLSMALGAVESSRRTEAAGLVQATGLAGTDLVPALRAIQGAKSVETAAHAVWTMPGHLVTASPLTTSTAELVRSARTSVVCSTYNFQETSGLWLALRDAATRPGVRVRVYVDAEAASGASGPDATSIAGWLAPAKVFRTVPVNGKPVRNHAKFVSVDHRFLIVTSANYSWSAENRNVELGVRLDDPALADAVEGQMRDAEALLYERIVG